MKPHMSSFCSWFRRVAAASELHQQKISSAKTLKIILSYQCKHKLVAEEVLFDSLCSRRKLHLLTEVNRPRLSRLPEQLSRCLTKQWPEVPHEQRPRCPPEHPKAAPVCTSRPQPLYDRCQNGRRLKQERGLCDANPRIALLNDGGNWTT